MSRRGWTGLFGVLAVLGCFLPHASDAEEPVQLVVIVHPSSPAQMFSAIELRAVFTRVLRHWSDGTPVTAVNLAPGIPERVIFDRVVLQMEPDEVAQFWIDQKIRGDSPPPRQLASGTAIVDLVSRTPGAIGYVVAPSLVKPGVKIVARIRRNQVVPP